MTPKEKALQLCQKFGTTTLFAEDCNNGYTLPLRVAKLCANIAVDEVLKAHLYDEEENHYFIEVKKEIEKL